MNRNKELAKNTIILTVGKICTQFMSFFLMPLYTALLTTAEYGVVDLVITYTSLCLPFILLQVEQAQFRFLLDVRGNIEGQKKVVSSCFFFVCFQCIVATLIVAIISAFINIPYIFFLLLNVLATMWSSIMLQIARGFGDNFGYATASFLSAFTQICGNVIFLIAFKMGVHGMLTATIVANFMVAVFLFIKERVYKYISIICFDRILFRKILSYALPMVPNNLCWWALNASDRTIVLAFLGASSNGLLSVGHKFSSLYITFYNIFNLSWTESASLHISDEDRDKFFSDIITVMFKFFMSMAIGMISCIPFIFPIVINIQFQDAYNIIPVFILSSMLNVVVGLYSVVYIALKKSKEVAKTAIWTSLINIGVHLLLINWIGLMASAVSTVVAFLVMAIYRYYDTKRYINIILPPKWILLTLIMFVLSCYSYYLGNLWINVIVLVISVIFAIVANMSIIKSTIQTFKDRFKVAAQ